jgi:hypothetical protein
MTIDPMWREHEIRHFPIAVDHPERPDLATTARHCASAISLAAWCARHVERRALSRRAAVDPS